jgi:STE24 endopeptidase
MSELWQNWVLAGLILSRLGVQCLLQYLNQRHVQSRAGSVPEPLLATTTPDTYRKSVEYTLAQGRFSFFEYFFEAIVLAFLIFSGVLPRLHQAAFPSGSGNLWAEAAWLVAVLVGISMISWPLQYWDQFRLEQRFGFNTSTPIIWFTDRIKAVVLSFVIGVPVMALLLWLVGRLGSSWWLAGWAAFMVIQLILTLVAPSLLLPLFNKLTPLDDGPLKNQLLALGEKAGFHAKSILVMDGSRRSRHSNAFFTGLGRWRKIVLFDTLLAQLKEEQISAVLAHEIGHYKLGHIPKMLLASAVGALVAFFVLGYLMEQRWFFEMFGFQQRSNVVAFLIFSLLSGLITFWTSPLASRWSRRYEYQADAFARRLIGRTEPMVEALQRLNMENLSNLNPHPWYSGFYYSHPTLLEREQSLRQLS